MAYYGNRSYGNMEELAQQRSAARARLAARQRNGAAQPQSHAPSGSSGRAKRTQARPEPPHAFSKRPQRFSPQPAARRRFPLAPVIALLALVVVFVGVGAAVMSSAGGGFGSDPSHAASFGSVSDAANAEPTVADSITMTLGGSEETYVLVGEDYLEAGCHAVDATEGDLTSTVQVSGTVDSSTVGDYVLTYTATRSDGAQATKDRVVHVVESFDGNAASLPVLMYHYVYTENDQPDEVNGNYLLDSKLEAQLKYLTENGYYYPSYQEVKAFAEGAHTLPAKSVVLTFDDGESGFLKYGIPLLEQYRVPATSFLICSDEETARKVVDYASEYVSFQSHSYAMHQAGSNVGRGGRIHAMSQDEIADDLRQAQEVLGTTEAFAYPFGDVNESAQAAMVDVGVLCAFTIINDRVYPGDDPTALNRVRIAGDYEQSGFEYLVASDAA